MADSTDASLSRKVKDTVRYYLLSALQFLCRQPQLILIVQTAGFVGGAVQVLIGKFSLLIDCELFT